MTSKTKLKCLGIIALALVSSVLASIWPVRLGELYSAISGGGITSVAQGIAAISTFGLIYAVMGFTLNYQYNTTQKFIMKLPGKPVSCVKLREQYKLITAEYGCSCNFKRTKNCYPSPVLHAIKNSDNEQSEITVPMSRTLSKAKEEKVYEEINIHKQTEKLALKIVELKKQKTAPSH